MFDLVQHPQWPPKRPERTGFLVISIFWIAITIGFVVRDHIFINSKHPKSNNSAASDQSAESDKPSGMPDVEIRRWRATTIVPAPKRALKCRCHLDTQVPGQTIDHHSTQFAMCKLITHSDQEWHRGFFDRREVLIRWHCAEQ
jgi:hypothetical protein